ncbi:MAG: aspartate dehydrogenase [Lachnospiraceae bacterium]|nr:aspartate dehydrogenase [Lachnospiraceae bacterium]
MFGRKEKHASTVTYDREKEKPVLRCSICTGEQVFGFRNMETGKFEEVSLIRNEKELKELLGQYGIAQDEVEKVY